jgi:hypothetical protein
MKYSVSINKVEIAQFSALIDAEEFANWQFGKNPRIFVEVNKDNSVVWYRGVRRW